jgi:hypothetical protein
MSDGPGFAVLLLLLLVSWGYLALGRSWEGEGPFSFTKDKLIWRKEIGKLIRDLNTHT